MNELFLSIDLNIEILEKFLIKEYANNDNILDISLQKAFQKYIEYEIIEKYNQVNKVEIVDYIPLLNNFCDLQKVKLDGIKIAYVKIKFNYEKSYNLKSFFINLKNKDRFYFGDFYNTFSFNKKGLGYTEIRNLCFDSILFKNLGNVENCNCENLRLFKHNNILPVVFQCERCGKLYMCSCQKKYYDIIYNDYQRKTLSKNLITDYRQEKDIYSWNYFYKKARFKDNICHVCTKTTPPYNECCDLSEFAKYFLPYIESEVLAYFGGSYWNDNHTDFKVSYFEIKKVYEKIEEKLREKADYPHKGKWINEDILYKICKSLFEKNNDDIVIRQYSPSWLKPLRLDIYIPKAKLGIEYQGLQHYKPIDYFGGKENFEKQKGNDKRKASLCKKNNIDLIYFDYKENLTEELVKRKLKKYLK